jgi:glycerol-3-phosphate dehydrogenase
MNRLERWQRLQQGAFDVLVIGGGATGLGVAVDCAQRGMKVALVEAHDYGKGTSSRATKLLHGGVRYLAQGNIKLVREALHERTAVLRNASALAKPLPFVMPSYRAWQTPFYGLGLKMYDLLAGSASLGSTELLGAQAVQTALPNVHAAGLKGGVKYWDAQFDDARLAWALAATAQSLGATLVNHARVTRLLHDESQRVSGAKIIDGFSGDVATIHAKCVINATGIWVDDLRMQDGQILKRPVKSMVAPSQGVHVVVDNTFWPGEHALLVPKTQDGRVLFAVPWLGSVILGTTDTPREEVVHDPQPLKAEVDFILGEAARYMARAPKRSDVKSVWVGMRPLVKPQDDDGEPTKALSREHTILISKSGLVTVTGGKWTTYRAMAEDVIERAQDAGLMQRGAPCKTAQLLLNATAGIAPADLKAADVLHMAQHEHACTAEDVLARRCRALFLDAALAARLAPDVADSLQSATGLNPKLDDFLRLCRQYQTLP